MSLKTRVLLHRTGRNQFGDAGGPPLPRYKPSKAQQALDDSSRRRHEELNELFVRCHGAPWLSLFPWKTREATWKKLYPHRRPALSTFRRMVRESGSLEDFLLYWLVANKRKALSLLGYRAGAIDGLLKEYAGSGRYFVTYGKSPRQFATT